MKLNKYNEFINESVSRDSEKEFLDVLNMPLDQRKEFQSTLEDLIDAKDKVDEANIPDILSDVGKFFRGIYDRFVDRFKNFLSKKAVAYLINQNEKELKEKIDILRMLDPTDMSDVDKCEAMYLGGAIDKATGEGAAGWRDRIEEYFGMDHVVQGEDMIKLGKSGKLDYDKYPKPLILNPLRNELVRDNDPRFAEIFRKWKSGELNKEEDHEDWKYWSHIINKEIYAPDLRIVNACDTNLVKLNASAGAGTLGEMQVTQLRNMNLFLWLADGYQVQDISPWTIPSITKLVRSDQELQILLDNIKNMNEGK